MQALAGGRVGHGDGPSPTGACIRRHGRVPARRPVAFRAGTAFALWRPRPHLGVQQTAASKEWPCNADPARQQGPACCPSSCLRQKTTPCTVCRWLRPGRRNTGKHRHAHRACARGRGWMCGGTGSSSRDVVRCVGLGVSRGATLAGAARRGCRRRGSARRSCSSRPRPTCPASPRACLHAHAGKWRRRTMRRTPR